jgi:hypothetical protein
LSSAAKTRGLSASAAPAAGHLSEKKVLTRASKISPRPKPIRTGSSFTPSPFVPGPFTEGCPPCSINGPGWRRLELTTPGART